MNATLRAIGSRLIYGVPVLIIVTAGAAALLDFMPGSPGLAILGDSATPEQVARINASLGYDLPFWERYFNWAGQALQGNFGNTLFTQEPVLEVLMRRLGVTAQLALMAMLSSLIIAVPFALLAALRAGGILDRVLGVIASALLSLPSFVTVVLLSLIFVVAMPMFPATGWVPPTEDLGDNLRHAFLPVLALAVHESAFFYRVVRTDLSGVLREDFVTVARAKGLPKARIMFRHALRPSLTSLATVMGLSLGRMLGGAVIVEFFFSVPGIGAEAVTAVSVKDMPMIQAIMTLCVLVYVVIFIIVDLAYAWIDPRVSVR